MPINVPDNINRMLRIPPRFPHLVNGNPRTINECEGWNNRFRNLVGRNHRD